MRIGILCYPTSGGSGVVASELGMALAGRGHEIHLFSYARPFRLGPLGDRFTWHEIAVPQYPLFEYPSYGMAAACKVAEVDLDLLHVHYAYPHSVSAHLAKQMSGNGLRTVTTLHGTDIQLVGQDASFTRATRFGLERSDAVTAVSGFLRDKTRAWFDPVRPIEVIPDFVDTRRFSPGGRSDGDVLVHVSNFRPVKRAADAVRVLYLLRKKRPAELVMVGSGPEQKEARALAERLDVLDHVRFAGEEPDIVRPLRGASLMLSTSEFEGFGLAALEALACGVPVVATDSGGIREVVDASCARLHDVGDVECLARSAAELLDDPARRAAMGEAGVRRARSRFDVEVVVSRYEQLYKRVMGERHAQDISV